MKVTMLRVWSKPEGTATAGRVMELPNKEAEEMIAQQVARPYDPKRDSRAKVGFERPEK